MDPRNEALSNLHGALDGVIKAVDSYMTQSTQSLTDAVNLFSKQYNVIIAGTMSNNMNPADEALLQKACDVLETLIKPTLQANQTLNQEQKAALQAGREQLGQVKEEVKAQISSPRPGRG